MDSDHNARPPPLPAKLRWRPYANGNSLKVKKPKKVPIQDMNPKAVAHKMRGKQYYSGKTHTLPVGVKLQWEEAETIESMSAGGHPHNHHPYHSSDSDSDISTSSTSPRRTSSTSDSSTNDSTSPRGTSTSNANSGFSGAIKRVISSLPSPPSSQPLHAPISSGIDFVGGRADFGLFSGSVPCISDTDFMKHGLPLSTLASNTAYQLAFDALFQPQRSNILAHSTSTTTNNNYGNNNGRGLASGMAGTATSTTNTSGINVFSAVPLNAACRDTSPVFSNDDLLNMASIDELLSSCGYSDAFDTTMQMLSPDTDQSYNSSPMSTLIDYSNSSRGTSPEVTSFSPMALLAQPIYPVTQQQQSSQQGLFTTATASVNASTFTSTIAASTSATSDTYTVLAQEFSAPFSYISANGVDSTGAGNIPTAWPSLFPPVPESVKAAPPQRTEMATQTDGPYSPAVSPMAGKITATTIQATLGLKDDELDPDWLNFLDEASPLFDAELPMSPPHSGDEEMPLPRVSQPSSTSKNNWRGDQTFKPDLASPPTGHRGFPSSSGALGGVGQLGSGGLIRTLQGTSQQRVKKPNNSKSSTISTGDTIKTTTATAATGASADGAITSSNANQPSINDHQQNSSDHDNESTGSFGDLLSMIKNLWTTKE
ncbi:hypothetical protein BG004_006004 [Podila humilis]|nr:hypothetical protein BG004_006004 [Podila humilis]